MRVLLYLRKFFNRNRLAPQKTEKLLIADPNCDSGYRYWFRVIFLAFISLLLVLCCVMVIWLNRPTLTPMGIASIVVLPKILKYFVDI